MPSSNKSFDAIVIGSGVAGLSTAMQLGLRSLQVLVLERSTLGSGATSRAAGLLGQMRTTVDAVRLLMDSVRVLRAVEDRAGMEIYHQTGSIRIAQTEARVRELHADMAVAAQAGLVVHSISTEDASRLMPCMRVDDIIEAAYCPTDGYLEPVRLAEAYIQVGRATGVRYVESAPVEGLLSTGGRVTGVRAGGTEYHAPVVVNAAGPWAHLVANRAEQRLPTSGIAHYYFTTRREADITVDGNCASVRDRENRIYARPKDGCLRVGIYERQPEVVEMSRLPTDFSMSSVTVGKEHSTVKALIEASCRRFHGLDGNSPIEIRGGIMAFTPDGGPLIGTIEGLEGFVHCAGFCGHGISQSPAIGPLMADLIVGGACQYDLEQLEADRFADMPGLQDRSEVDARCRDVYANYYNLAADHQ